MPRNERFSSWATVLIAAMALDVGSGNIWRFPRMAAQYGGASFVITWLSALFLWSVPILIVEYAFGRKTRLGVSGAFGYLLGPRWNWIGLFLGGCTLFITCYYSVVNGWAVRYTLEAARGRILERDSETMWNSFTSGYEPVMLHAVATIFGCTVLWFGIRRGVERVTSVMVPALFVLLAISAGRAIMLPGAERGLEFLFRPDWSAFLRAEVWLQGVSQSAWSVGPGWGLFLTMGAYLRRRDDIVLQPMMMGLGNNSASLLAAIAVLCSVFGLLSETQAQDAISAGNFGLTFIWMPRLFAEMPGGNIFAFLFFLCLAIATLSSLILMMMVITTFLEDLGLHHRLAVITTGGIVFSCGLPSALSRDFLENQDWVWGLGLLVGGALTAFAAVRYGTQRVRNGMVNLSQHTVQAGKWFDFVLWYMVPVEFVGLMVWWLWQSATSYEPEAWYHPFKTYSLATVGLQWGLLLLAAIVLGPVFTRLSVRHRKDQ